MLKKIGEESTCQQTFMECHTVADSVLERASPPRNRDIDQPLSPPPFTPPKDLTIAPKPFTPPKDAPVDQLKPFTPPQATPQPPPPTALPIPRFISPEEYGRTSGPMTATPVHPVRTSSKNLKT